MSKKFSLTLTKFYESLIEMVKRELELMRLNSHAENRVLHAVGRLASHAFNYGGHIGTHLIVGGYDVKGPQLLEVSSDGHSKHSPFLTTGSGSLAAMGVMETEYRDNMTEQEAIALVSKAIEAGIYHDLGSGSNLDVCIIKKGGKINYMRNLKKENFKMFSKPDGYNFRKDRVKVLEEYRHKLVESKGEIMQLN